MAARLGASAAFIGKVGRDMFGDFLKSELELHGVNTDGLIFDKDHPTSLAFVRNTEDGERQFMFYRRNGADLSLSYSDVNLSVIDSCRIFHFGALSLTAEPLRSATVNAVEYAKSKGKTGYKYIASIGKEWSEKEIDSLESAEEYIREQHTTDTVWAAFRELTGAKNRNPTAKQKRYLTGWSKELGFPFEMIALAYEICIDNTNKVSLEYMDRVLQSWRKAGVRTPADADRAQQQWNEKRFAQKGKKTVKPSKAESVYSSDASYDLDAFSKHAIGMEDFVPKK
jgi:DnaD/phage-associated family protein